MILLGYNWSEILLGILYVSLGLLIVVILYRKLLSILGRGKVVRTDYCELYALEQDPASGELTFYFTTSKDINFKLLILDTELNDIICVAEKKATPGGNIIRFDSKQLENGVYFYSLVTENQRTMKKMTIKNA